MTEGADATRSGQSPQGTHYDEIGAAYDAHYSDPTSERYRELFINGPLLGNLDLQGRRVLEAMCGSGSTAAYLLAKGATLTGLDISEKLIAVFRARWPQARAIQGSILASGLAPNSYDLVVVVGGLHHVQPLVQEAIDEIFRVLVPGGYLCFAEPHSGSLPDVVRRRWYRLDPLFERAEQAIDVDALEAHNAERFELITRRFCGNVAYLFVFNSLVFRVPIRLKRFYAPILLTLEAMLARFQGRRLSCFVLCQWKKRAAP
jgi:SAM-dependent methyltransferase